MNNLTLYIVYVLIIQTSLPFFSFSQEKEEYYPDGTVRGRGEYGEFKYTNVNVGLVSHPKTKFSKKIGEWTYWYKSGSLMMIENYKKEKKGTKIDPVPHGPWKYFDEDEECEVIPLVIIPPLELTLTLSVRFSFSTSCKAK